MKMTASIAWLKILLKKANTKKHAYGDQMKRYALLLLALSSFYSNAQDNLTALGTDKIKQWEKEVFSGETVYEQVSLEGEPVLRALSNKSASGLVLKKRIDLQQTPFIQWRWRIAKQLPNLKEQTKAGDDYAARIYLVIEDGFMGLKTKALNYVWSSSQVQGSVWNNAYVGENVKMLAIQGQSASTHQWYSEKRNVYQDMIRYFGEKGSSAANLEAYRYIDAVAIMTDTDNSGLAAESYYGDIVFSVE